MRESASGELVKSEVGQVRLRRCGEVGGPARPSAASRPKSVPLVAAFGVAVVLLATPRLAVGAPGPDPHPSARQPVGSPTPDPSPADTQVARTPEPVRAAPSVTTTHEPVTTPSSSRSAPARTRTSPKPKPTPTPRPSARTSPTAQAKVKTAAVGGLTAAASGARSGEHQSPLAAASTAVTDSVEPPASDPMVLGAFALLTLALASAGLLLILGRSHRRGAQA